MLITSFAQHQRVYGLSDGTIKLRAHYVTRWIDAYPNPWTVPPSAVTRWLDQPAWSASTRRDALAALRAFYRWAVSTSETTTDPTAGLPPVRTPRPLPRPMPEDALAVTLARVSTRDRLIVALAGLAGARRDEIARMRWDAEDGGGLIIDGKGGRQRWVPMSDRLAILWGDVRDLRAAGLVEDGWRFAPDPSSPFVLPGLRGGHMHRDAVGKIAAALMPDAWTLHTARHRFATQAYRGTRDLRSVQELLGHSSPMTTQRYVQVDRDDLRAAVQAAA